MLQHLRELGTNVPFSSIHCVPCNSAGTAHPPSGHIFLCQGRHLSKSHMEDAMTHELIHLYDHARFKVDWDNLRHHACSEVELIFADTEGSSHELKTDSREQFEWRLLIGKRDSAWVPVIYKTSPGWCSSNSIEPCI